MTELSERIRRNTTPNLDGWIKRLLTEAATEIERLHALVESRTDGLANMQRHRDQWRSFCKGTRTDAPSDYLEGAQ